MTQNHRQKLIDLGADELADSLLDLAQHSTAADELVDRLIASPADNIQRFKKKLASLKRSSRFIDWRESSAFARELEGLLQDLKVGITEPLAGMALIAAFYEADEGILGRCDDSSGEIGDVFRIDAKELFVAYASSCSEKNKIADIVLKINRKNEYGIRDALIDCATEYLPESAVRRMIQTLSARVEKATDEYAKRGHLMLIESLAEQIKDPKLFEQTRIASWGKLSTAAFVDIARVYLANGDAHTALAWLEKIPNGDTFKQHEHHQLLLKIYQLLGDTEKQSELLYQKFQAHRSLNSLDILLGIIGDNKRDKLIEKETSTILKSTRLQISDTKFLIAIGKIDEAEHCVLQRAEQLNGDFYGELLSLADLLETEHRGLAASVIFRSLLSSILERGYTKSYAHGIRYLKKLDKLAGGITNWANQSSHDEFKAQISDAHGRKYSFWDKYNV